MKSNSTDRKIKKVTTICGSLRKDSVNQQLLERIAVSHKYRADFEFIDIRKIPWFLPGLDDADLPSEVKHFYNRLAASDAVLFSTPEYVFSLPGVLKNALEWLVATTILTDKPVAVITAAAGGEKAHESLVLILETLGAKVNTNILIQGAKGKLSARGEISDLETAGQLNKISSFLASI